MNRRNLKIQLFSRNELIEFIDIAENERIRTQGWPVNENLCVIMFVIMNHHKLFMIFMLKYHLKFWYLSIYWYLFV